MSHYRCLTVLAFMTQFIISLWTTHIRQNARNISVTLGKYWATRAQSLRSQCPASTLIKWHRRGQWTFMWRGLKNTTGVDSEKGLIKTGIGQSTSHSREGSFASQYNWRGDGSWGPGISLIPVTFTPGWGD